ncbi:ATP-grasp domain-containing protein [Paracoccus sp. FO-3]|uniref:ATP-grasp domain-containing protein n=1 Tax=Paracoccus sp. FO-3 TaxID=1335059 RepID=UPI00112E9920|nr:ATP-grasp domain-containing protein [Paracoccus sp. FO-3]
MQWILQRFEDTQKLADALDRLGISYSWHKVVPFVGDLVPEPEVRDPQAVVMFGSYTLWRYAEAKGFHPGVFRVAPFVHERPWQPFMLNGPDATFLRVGEIEAGLPDDGRHWFIRPVADSKEQAGNVKTAAEIRETARKVMSLDPDEIPNGSLRPDTLMMLTPPARILKEWRIWIVNGDVVTYSLYKEGARVTYRHEIDEDALEFAQTLARLNEDYSPAYVMDICRTEEGLRLLETNCINAAGFYAADLMKLAAMIDGMACTVGKR